MRETFFTLANDVRVIQYGFKTEQLKLNKKLKIYNNTHTNTNTNTNN